MFFETPHGVANCGRGDTDALSGAREAALLRDGEEHGQFAEVVAFHL